MKISDCPFCGREEAELYLTNKGHRYACERCNTKGPSTMDGEDHALKLWNKRAKDPAILVEALERQLVWVIQGEDNSQSRQRLAKMINIALKGFNSRLHFPGEKNANKET